MSEHRPARGSHASATRVAEDYVTAIWKAAEWSDERLTHTALAARLGVAKSTVSTTLRRLAADGLLHHEPYGDIRLTEAGTSLATAVVRRHRLIESYLVEQLGLQWDEVHVEADRLEHAVSDRVLASMCEALGDPATDPHGDPIPPHVPERLRDARRLDLVEGRGDLVVVRVFDGDPEVLRYLAARGIAIDTRLAEAESLPGLGLVRFVVDGTVVELSTAIAQHVYVSGARRPPPSGPPAAPCAAEHR